jgi:hypothetical protein
MRPGSQRGGASVEHVALVMLVALMALAGIAAFASSPPLQEGRELGSAIARKLRCAPRLPGPCWRDPLTEAYGRPVAGLVRALAPVPAARPAPDGTPLLPVDFRYCRSQSCAMPADGIRLTASNRRTTAFTSVSDERRSGGPVTATYWLYRPTLGWERIDRRATSEDVTRLASTPLLDSADPKLVPLETLDGRNQFDFAPGEEPPWRWKVPGVYPD